MMNIKSYFFIKNCYYLMIIISFIQIVTTSSSEPTETAVNTTNLLETNNSTNPATNITFVIKTSNIIPETANSTINLTNSTEINNLTTSSIDFLRKPFVIDTTVNATNLFEITNNSTNHNTTIPFLTNDSNKPFVTEVNPTNLFETNSSTYFNSKNLPTNITTKYSIILEAASMFLINFHVYTRELN
jgi:hypothetical protein